MFRQFSRFRSTIRMTNSTKFNETYVNKLSDYYINLIKEYKDSSNKLIYFSMTGYGGFLYIIKQDIDKRFENIDKRFETIDKRFEEIKNDNKIFKNEIKELIISSNNRRWF